MKSIIDYSQIEPPKRKENEKPDTEEEDNDKPETGGNGGIETLKSEGQHGWMEKLLKKVRIYHLDSDLHFQSPPQTGSLPVSGNLKYTLRNPKRLDRGKINWIPAVKLASDRLFRSFFFSPPARRSYGQRSTEGGWSAMGIRLHRTQSKRHLKA